MKHFSNFILALTLLCAASFSLSAQKTYTDWHYIDKITINADVHASDYSVLYLVPINEDPSIVKFEDSRPKVVKKVFDQVAAFRPMIQKSIKGAYKKMDVKIVDEVPASLAKGEMMISIKYTEFNLGSAALRAWVGGGNAGITLDITIATADRPDAIVITQRHMSGLLSPNAYDKILKEQQGKFAKDFVVIFKELEK